jgi:surface protein
MATLAAYPEWYDRSGNVVICQDITEVAVVGSYAPTGNEVASWNAASEGSIMCHIVGTKLTIVWSDLTEIPDKMFTYFVSLEKITGLNDVTVIGKSAFYQCHSLKSVDLNPKKLTNIGDDAFRISSMEDVLDVSQVPYTAVGERATRRKRWGDDELDAIQSIAFPKKRIYLDVANPDSQLKDVYKDEKVAAFLTDEKSGEVTKTLYNGCSRFILYHAWNYLYAGTDKEYPNMLAWWTGTLNKNGDYAQNTHDTTDTLPADYATLGWEDGGVEHIVDASQLSYILNELSQGFPVTVGIKTSSAYHGILIVGCDPVTRKLAYVDSGVRKDRGVVCWVAYEDLFIGGETTGVDESEMIRKIDFNAPVLAPNSSWFTQGSTTTKRASIREIEIVRSYVPTGSETDSWDASADLDGSVMAYVNGTTLTIAGNGYPSVWANEDSSFAFSDSDTTKKDYFLYATVFNGLSLLNTSKAVDMQRMFRQFCDNKDNTLLFLDVANWNTSNVKDMTGMFDRCPIEYIAVDGWDVSSVENFSAMFMGCLNLREINLSKWDVSDEWTVSTTAMFDGAQQLEKISVGKSFVFDILSKYPTLDPTLPARIPYADGKWYTADYQAYAPTEIPSGKARTYYASKFLAADDDDSMVFIRNGTLRKLAVAIRHKNGKADEMYPSEFADEVLALEIQQN